MTQSGLGFKGSVWRRVERREGEVEGTDSRALRYAGEK